MTFGMVICMVAGSAGYLLCGWRGVVIAMLGVLGGGIP